MSMPRLENRLIKNRLIVEDVAHLRARVALPPTSPHPWWSEIAGQFAENAAFDEAMQLGQQYRQSQTASALPSHPDSDSDRPHSSLPIDPACP